jgi:hypothetical protein
LSYFQEKYKRYSEYTDCAVTPCSALSQASCQSPDSKREASLLPEEVEKHVGVTRCKKSPAKAAMVIRATKHQEVAVLRHAVLAVVNFAALFGGVGESCFLK